MLSSCFILKLNIILPHVLSRYCVHEVFSLKISCRNTLWTLEKFKLLIQYVMFILVREKMNEILGQAHLKPILVVWGQKLFYHIEEFIDNVL